MTDLLSVSEAQARILSAFHPGAPEHIALGECAGRILAEPIHAPDDLPRFDYSSMDGYAVQSADLAAAAPDTPISLRVIADIPAGSHPTIAIQAGQSARIMTGAPMPSGADAVIPIEDCHADEANQKVLCLRSVQPGDSVRPRGEDIHQGQRVLEGGQPLRPQDLGLLASLGMGQLAVVRRPRIALFSSGDELVEPGQPLGPAQIYNANTYLLAAVLEQAGAEVIQLGTSPDDPQAVEGLLRRAVTQKADCIVTSAGVSVGAYDYVRQVIEANGRLNFWRVNVRPGKPLAFGSFGGIPIIGLPGNPVSAFVGCLLFVLPVIYRLAGRAETQPPRLRAILEEAIGSDGRESYLRAVARHENGTLLVALSGHQGSGNLYALTQANALLIVPNGVKSLPSGAEVEIWPLDPNFG